MPKRRNRRREADEEWIDQTRYPGDDSSDISALSEHEVHSEPPRNGNGNTHLNEQSNGSRSRQRRETGLLQQSQHNVSSFEPWTQAVNETVQGLQDTERRLNNLQKSFRSHQNDLEKVEETSRKLRLLEEECQVKDKELDKRATVIGTLREFDQERKNELQKQEEKLKVDQLALEQGQAKQEKRVEARIAEERHTLMGQIEQRMKQEAETFNGRKQELEDDFSRKKAETDKRATALESDRTQLLGKVKKQDELIETQTTKLKTNKELLEDANRLKVSLKRDIDVLEKELDEMRAEFSLNVRTKDYFVEKFTEIDLEIERISTTYFHDLKDKDPDEIHKALAEADSRFRSVPILETADSRDLCYAHAQRIICNALCEDIWKPFSSESTFFHPKFSDFLNEISTELGNSNYGPRIASFWKSLTMQALQSLPPTSVASQTLVTIDIESTRTKSVLSRIAILDPLVSRSQAGELETDLLHLIKSAISIWNEAHTGGLTIMVLPELDPAHREEWRSHQFDPRASLHSGEISDFEQISKTHPRVFTLFPRIIVRETAPMKTDRGLPGSFPAEPPGVTVTPIHPGKGLPEWSPLVVRGKSEQEEIQDEIKRVMEDATRQVQNVRRGHGRRDSRGSSVSFAPSLLEQGRISGSVKLARQ